MSDIFRDFFGLERRALFETTILREDVDPLTSAIVPNDAIARIQAAIHIFFPIATATPGTDKLNARKLLHEEKACPALVLRTWSKHLLVEIETKSESCLT